ncbi:hypothetical protein [Microbispora sp. NPDC046933]|uniref:hypothetical protein n=1 Tax=Microbispora sp. NPDC046933 TaxID=3155618 RepID=UPI0033E16EA7
MPQRADEVLAGSGHLAEVVANPNVWVGNREELSDQSPRAGLPVMSMSEHAALIDTAELLLQRS